MTWRQRWARRLVRVGLIMLGAGCSDPGTGPKPTASIHVRVSPGSTTIPVGGTVQLIVSIVDDAGNPVGNRTVTWTSADSSVATVSPTGVVTGMSTGSASITATSESQSGSASVLVGDQPPAIPGLLLSNPVFLPTASFTGRASAIASPGDSIVFISIQPGLAPQGVTARVKNLTTGLSINTFVVNGGFDPVSLKGQVGDSVEVTVLDGSSVTLYHAVIAVRATVPPVIVRTQPPHKKTDVPLNSFVAVVFSEPIAAPTLTTTSLALMEAGNPVPGTVRFLDSTRVTAQFVPTGALKPATTYQLLVTSTIQDLRGQPLATPAIIEFTTGDGTASQAVWDVKVAPSAATILQLGTVQLTATAWSVGDSFQVYGHPVTWSSSNPTIASVSPVGLVSGVGLGPVTITAAVDGIQGAASISVLDSQVVSVVVSPELVVVSVADSFQLQVVLRDGVGNVVTGRPVSWTSSALTVATVTPSGLVHAVAAGSATITATSEKGSGSATVAVQDGPILNVADLWDWSASDWVGGSTCADYGTFWLDQRDGTPFGGTVWSVGSCNSNSGSWTLTRGLVVGNTLTFSWDNGTCRVDGILEGDPPLRFTGTETCDDVGATRAIEARRHEPAGSLSLSPVARTIVLGASATLSTVVQDSAGRPLFGRLATWSSDNPAVATVSASGQVTGVSAGTATISAAVEGLTATAAITVESVTFTAVGAGYLNCGLSSGGAVYCWGDTPFKVSGNLTFTSLSVGLGQACGLVAGGAAYCWGYYSDTPAVVPGGLSFTSVTAGWYHACGLAAGGAAYCWGLNDSGQVGNGQIGIDAPAPVAVLGGLTFTSLSAGVRHTCGIATGGAAYCWGSNYFGQLGSGVAGNSAQPVRLATNLLFRSIAAGSSHTCANELGGALYCWGSYWYGEQGITDPFQTTPVRAVAGGPFASVSVGGVPTMSWDASYTFGYTCGVTVAGTGMCWGWNGYGQLGDGSVTQRPTPAAVAGGLAFASISTGRVHSCALTTAGVAYCWGAPGNGDGTTTGSAVPVRVLGHP